MDPFSQKIFLKHFDGHELIFDFRRNQTVTLIRKLEHKREFVQWYEIDDQYTIHVYLTI